MNAPAPGTEGAAVPFAPSVLDQPVLDPGRIEGRIKNSLLRKVRKLVDDFPDQALIVIRAWMAEGR